MYKISDRRRSIPSPFKEQPTVDEAGGPIPMHDLSCLPSISETDGSPESLHRAQID
jgi:hypothetical protein